MIDDHRVRQMAREYDMNPSTARRAAGKRQGRAGAADRAKIPGNDGR